MKEIKGAKGKLNCVEWLTGGNGKAEWREVQQWSAIQQYSTHDMAERLVAMVTGYEVVNNVVSRRAVTGTKQSTVIKVSSQCLHRFSPLNPGELVAIATDLLIVNTIRLHFGGVCLLRFRQLIRISNWWWGAGSILLL